MKGGTEDELAEALEGLAPGQGGWITIEEAQWLFSALDEGDTMALTEFDTDGLKNLGSFATECRCLPQRSGDMMLFIKSL